MGETIEVGKGRVVRHSTQQNVGSIADKSIELRHLAEDITNKFITDLIFVGSQSQVDTGQADFTSIQAAHDSTTVPTKIICLEGTFSENLSWTKNQHFLEGRGNGSVIDGNLTIDGDSNLFKFLKVTGNVTFNGNRNRATDNWIATASVLSDVGTDNRYDFTEE